MPAARQTGAVTVTAETCRRSCARPTRCSPPGLRRSCPPTVWPSGCSPPRDEQRPLRVKLGIDPSGAEPDARPRRRPAQAAAVPGLRARRRPGRRRLHRPGRRPVRAHRDPRRAERRAGRRELRSGYFDQLMRILDPEPAPRSSTTPTGSRRCGVAEILDYTRQLTVAQLLERDDFARRFAGAAADQPVRVLLPAAAGHRLGRGRTPTSSSAAPTRRSTTWWAASCSARGASTRRPCSPCRCSSAPTAWRRWASRSATTSPSPSRPDEQFGKLMIDPGLRRRPVRPAVHRAAPARGGGARGGRGRRRRCPRTGPSAGWPGRWWRSTTAPMPPRPRRPASTRCSGTASCRTTLRRTRCRTGDPVHLAALLVAAGLAASTSAARRDLERRARSGSTASRVPAPRSTCRARSSCVGRVLSVGKRRAVRLVGHDAAAAAERLSEFAAADRR